LHQNVALLGADGLADADLARPLRDRDEHDVHDADPAYQQRDPRDGAQHDVQVGGDLVKDAEDFLLGGDGKVVLFEVDVVSISQDNGNLVDSRVGARLVDGRRVQRIHTDPGGRHVAAGIESLHRRVQRDQDQRVPADAALLFQHADDAEGHPVDTDRLAERAAGIAKQVLGRLVAKQRHPAGRCILAGSEELAVGYRVIADGFVFRGGPGHRYRDGFAAIGDRRRAAHLGDNVGHVLCIGVLQDGLAVLAGQRLAAAPAEFARGDLVHAAGDNKDEVRSDALHLAGDGGAGPLAHREQPDDGARADDDAQHGQYAAQFVGQKAAQRHGKALQDRHAGAACSSRAASGVATRGLATGSSLTMRPSRRRTMRRVCAAMSDSWVTNSTVMPRSRFSR